MSKSKGNLIAPEHHFETVGADALRLFHLFVGPPFDDMDWSDQTEQVIDGCGRFLDRLWRTVMSEPALRTGAQSDADRVVRQAVHRTVDDVTRDLERWSYNTAVAHCMELLNLLQRYAAAERGARTATGPARGTAPTETCGTRRSSALLRLLAPLTPHVTAELWEHRHPGEPSVHLQPWPTPDAELVRQERVTMVIQVNGKVRDRVDVDAGISEADARDIALGLGQGDRGAEWSDAHAGRVPAAPPGQRRHLTGAIGVGDLISRL